MICILMAFCSGSHIECVSHHDALLHMADRLHRADACLNIAPGYPSADQGDLMRTIIVALVASALLTGCVSSSSSNSQPPNYVSSQATQSPGIRNDAFGGAAMQMRGLPR